MRTVEEVQKSIEEAAVKMAEVRVSVSKELENIVKQSMLIIAESPITYTELYSELKKVAHTDGDFNRYMATAADMLYRRDHA